MSDTVRACDDPLSDDDPLLRAVSRAPRAEGALDRVVIPPTLRLQLGGSSAANLARLPDPGSIIDGRYRIDARLGSGGMGVVFAATHLQTKKRVALKWMSAEVRLRSASDELSVRRRFEREARIAARVRHPNVVDVYDAGSDDTGAYLVMELPAGETLRERMDRGKLSWDEALELLLPAMRGVAALHEQGVIHRDLKPENIYLARSADGLVVPKVLDFGVAALRELDADEQDETLTRPGTVLGTPGYMPLEQLLGERALDVRTDLYALGVVLYEALATRRPVVAGNAAEHAARLATETPMSVAASRPELRGRRSEAVMKALARDREQRPATVQTFIELLKRAQHDRWSRPALVLSVVVLTLLATFAAVFAMSQAPDVQPQEWTRSYVEPPPSSLFSITAEDRMPARTSSVVVFRPEAEAHATHGEAEPAAGAATVTTSSSPREQLTRRHPRIVNATPVEVLETPPPPRDRATSLSRDDF